jgi:ketosteroid isomerase-like protein
MRNNIDTAADLFAAIEAKDPAAVGALYADDVAVWHNFDDACQDKAANLATLSGLCAAATKIRYDVTERLELEAGRVLQRHVLRVSVPSGETFAIPACIFVTVANGKITRIDEYLDTGQANRLRAASGRTPIA